MLYFVAFFLVLSLFSEQTKCYCHIPTCCHLVVVCGTECMSQNLVSRELWAFYMLEEYAPSFDYILHVTSHYHPKTTAKISSTYLHFLRNYYVTETHFIMKDAPFSVCVKVFKITEQTGVKTPELLHYAYMS